MASISPAGLAVSPDGRRAYVMGGNSGLVSVIDTNRNIVIDTVIVGGHPWGIALTPDGRRGYISDYDSGLVLVMDTNRNVVVDSIALPVLPRGRVIPRPRPLGVAVSGDGRRAYILANCQSGMIHARSWVFTLDTYSSQISHMISVGGPDGGPAALWCVAVSPNGRRAYITDQGRKLVLMMDTVKNTITGSVNAESCVGIAISPDGHRAYSGLAVIDTAKCIVTDTITGSGVGWGVAVSPDGRRAYSTGSDSVSVIDTEKCTIIDTVIVTGSPKGVAISPDGRCVYTANVNPDCVSAITNNGSDSMSVIDIELT